MSVYRINHNFVEDGRHALKNRLSVQYTVLVTILCAGVIAAIWHRMGPREEFHVATYAIGITALAAVVVISLRDRWERGLSHLQKTVETYRLTVEPGKILCVRSGAKPVVLEPRDVIKVQEDRHGLHLCTKDPKLCIEVPPQLENFEACKDELRAQGLNWKSSVS